MNKQTSIRINPVMQSKVSMVGIAPVSYATERLTGCDYRHSPRLASSNMKVSFFPTIQAACVLALAAISSLYASSGPQPWTCRAPLPQGSSLRAAAYSPTLDTVVAVGDRSAVMTKVGNGTWSCKTLSAAAYGLAAITWTSDRFVAAGGSSTDGFFQSMDGVTWMQISGTTAEGASIAAMASGASATVALTWSGTVWVSTNHGATWIKKALPVMPKVNGTDVQYNSLATNGSRFVAVGSGGTIVTSPDASVWKKANNVTTCDLRSVASNGSGFVAVGYSWNSATQQNEHAILKSSDGVTWSPGAFPADQWGNEIYFYDGVFASGTGYIASIGGEFFTSPDGQTWTSAGSPEFAVASGTSSDVMNATAPAQSGSATLLVGDGGVVASFDGTNFKAEVTGYFGGFLWGAGFSAAGLDGLFLAVDTNGSGRLIESADGVTFSAASTGASAVARVGNTLVMFADGAFESTTDGTAWTPFGGGTYNGTVSSFAGLPQGPSVVVTREEGSNPSTNQWEATFLLYTSTDWTNWTEVTTLSGFSGSYSFQDHAIPHVQWDGMRFVLLSPNGRISTSANGLAWTVLPSLPSDTAAYLKSNYGSGVPAANLAASFASNGTTIVARSGKLHSGYFSTYGPDRFFVFSNGGWKQSQPGKDDWVNNGNVVWTGLIFASPNNEGMLNTSPDGVNCFFRDYSG